MFWRASPVSKKAWDSSHKDNFSVYFSFKETLNRIQGKKRRNQQNFSDIGDKSINFDKFLVEISTFYLHALRCGKCDIKIYRKQQKSFISLYSLFAVENIFITKFISLLMLDETNFYWWWVYMLIFNFTTRCAFLPKCWD